MASIIDKVRTFLTSEPTGQVEFNGETIPLYPVSAGMVRELKTIAKPLFKVASAMFSPMQETGHVQKALQDKQSDIYTTEDVLQPINPDLAKVKIEQRNARVEEIVEILTSDETHVLVCRFIADCMREPKAWQQLKGADLPTFIEFARAAFEANKAVFAPLAGVVPANLMQRLKDRMAPHLDSDESLTQETSTPPSPTTT